VQHLSRQSLQGAVLASAICPLPTVVALLTWALSGANCGIRGALLAHLRARDVAALLPLRVTHRDDGSGGRPNEIVPVTPGATMDEQLDAVAAIDPDEFADGIVAATEAGCPTGAWRAAVSSEPVRWLRAYRDALRRAWPSIEPLWSRSSGLMDRDVERVSVASARGVGAELLAQLFPFAAIAGEDLLLPSHSQRSGRVLAAPTLWLVPLAAPAESSGWTDDYRDRCLAVRYAVAAAASSLDDLPPPASLASLVGMQRARILRWLERSATAGELADWLHGTPSMITHHLKQLEKAGLITRTRDGRNVQVRRTERGSELIALYHDE
jgi:DNA-binding transcriptional ArsR family regulator